MTLIEIFTILIIHWIADFWLQTEQQGLGKSKNWTDLTNHTFTYSFIWLIVGGLIYLQHFKPYNGGLEVGYEKYVLSGLLFGLVTLITHTIQDYFTSRITSKRYENKHFYGFNGFWFWIGLDQVLHYIQLFTTYWYLKQ